MQKENIRNSGFELLRILAMLMIISHHLAIYGIGSESLSGFNSVIYTILALGGKIGVNLYVLISGYFLVTKKFSLKRFVNVILQTTFYSMLCFSTYSIATNSFNVEYFFHSLLPIIFSEYWFVTVYFILLLIFPLLNIIIKNITQKQHLIIIGVGLVLTIIITLALSLHYIDDNIWWFIELYFIAAYIRLYDVKIKGWILAVSLLICYIVTIVLNQFVYLADIFNANTIFNLLIAVSIFLLFKKLNFKSKFINIISSATFGVYLIHDNPYVRPRLWGIFKNFNLNSSPLLFIYSFIAIAAVFVAASIIELGRQYLIHKPLEWLYYNKVKPKLKKQEQKNIE